MPVSFLREAGAFLRARFAWGQRYGLAFTLALLAIGFGAWAFVEILDGITEEDDLYRFDGQIQAAFEQAFTPEAARYVVYLTNSGGFVGTLLLAGIVVVGLLGRRHWWRALELIVATGGGTLVVLGLKALFARDRPGGGFVEEASYSYPSGHAFMAVVFYGYLTYLVWTRTERPLWRVLSLVGALVMIALLGTSRLYLGVHWLTDVLGGYAAGLAWLAATVVALREVEHRRSGI